MQRSISRTLITSAEKVLSFATTVAHIHTNMSRGVILEEERMIDDIQFEFSTASFPGNWFETRMRTRPLHCAKSLRTKRRVDPDTGTNDDPR